MKLLSLETSSRNYSLAISHGSKVVVTQKFLLPRVLESSMMAPIEKILKRAKMKLGDLDGFAVGLGPGAFTCLRAGLSTIKGLAFAAGKPVVGISSLDVLAMNIKGDAACICTLGDAKRDLAFAAFYEKRGEILKRKSEYQLTTIDEVLRQVNTETVFIGDGIRVFHGQIKNASQYSLIKLAQEKLWIPQARHLSFLAYQRFVKKDFDDIETLIPLYLHPNDCQVRNT